MKTILQPPKKHKLDKCLLYQSLGIEELRKFTVFNAPSIYNVIDTETGYLINYESGPVKYTAVYDGDTDNLEILNMECALKGQNALAIIMIGIK